jgi:hypothetical membrane protein
MYNFRLSPSIRLWLPVFSYILLIFCLTPFLPQFTEYTAQLLAVPLPLFTVWIRNIIVAGLGVFLIAFMVYKRRYKQQSTYVALVIIYAWGALLVNNFGAPAEATHLLEYGGLAVLCFSRLRRYYRRMRSAPLYLVAAILAIWVGILDELYQGWLPNRYYDLNDIITNASSGILGLIYVWGVLRPGPLRQRVRSILNGGQQG